MISDLRGNILMDSLCKIWAVFSDIISYHTSMRRLSFLFARGEHLNVLLTEL